MVYIGGPLPTLCTFGIFLPSVKSIVVRMGTLLWYDLDNELYSVSMTTTKKVVHSKFNTTGNDNNDIALVKLPSTVPTTSIHS
jgi:hypothetical protein